MTVNMVHYDIQIQMQKERVRKRDREQGEWWKSEKTKTDASSGLSALVRLDRKGGCGQRYTPEQQGPPVASHFICLATLNEQALQSPIWLTHTSFHSIEQPRLQCVAVTQRCCALELCVMQCWCSWTCVCVCVCQPDRALKRRVCLFIQHSLMIQMLSELSRLFCQLVLMQDIDARHRCKTQMQDIDARQLKKIQKANIRHIKQGEALNVQTQGEQRS